MIDTVLNLLFRCSHRRLTRPMTAVSKAGVPHSEAYVVCLDCGKQFSYDLQQMRIGKPIDATHAASVVPPDLPKPRHGKIKVALAASVPVAMIIGSLVKSKKPAAKSAKADPEPGNPTPARQPPASRPR